MNVKIFLLLVNAHLRISFVEEVLNQEEKMVCRVNVTQCLVELSQVESGYNGISMDSKTCLSLIEPGLAIPTAD